MNLKVKKVGTMRSSKKLQTLLEVEARTRRWGPPAARVLLLDNGDGKLGAGDSIIEFHKVPGYCGGGKFKRGVGRSSNNYCAPRGVDSLDIALYRGVANAWFQKARLQEWKSVKQFLRKSKKRPIKRAYCLASRPRSIRYLPGIYLKNFSRSLTLKRKVVRPSYTDLVIRRIRLNQKADSARCASVVARGIKMSFAGFENTATLSWNGPIHSAIRFFGMFGLKSHSKVDFIYKDRATGVIFVHSGLGDVSTSQALPINIGRTNPNE